MQHLSLEPLGPSSNSPSRHAEICTGMRVHPCILIYIYVQCHYCNAVKLPYNASLQNTRHYVLSCQPILLQCAIQLLLDFVTTAQFRALTMQRLVHYLCSNMQESSLIFSNDFIYVLHTYSMCQTK